MINSFILFILFFSLSHHFFSFVLLLYPKCEHFEYTHTYCTCENLKAEKHNLTRPCLRSFFCFEMLHIIFISNQAECVNTTKQRRTTQKQIFKKWWKWNRSERRWGCDSGGAGMRWNNLFAISYSFLRLKNKWLHHNGLGRRYDACPQIHMQICTMSLSVFV